MEEDEDKIMTAIQKIEDQYKSNSEIDKNVRYALSLLKTKIKK
jgi:hypothetical protein